MISRIKNIEKENDTKKNLISKENDVIKNLISKETNIKKKQITILLVYKSIVINTHDYP